ncbi:hypothetical protein GPDM_16081 [Planococcus donghaensis MPA1U2]|uniref:Uncharacterized protein n=1 Tax=Planococcus donghaensis MPA1U2 TaxID=933115 RepID=E7RL41_9BACL|nr:hypothetical protein GPDM_16081 [Planococcus donghaensis MPA1U2]
MLLHRFASFVAKPLAELHSFNDFPRGLGRAEDPGLSGAREAAEAGPPGKRPPGAISSLE